MKKTLKFSVILLGLALIAGLTGCPTDTDDGGNNGVDPGPDNSTGIDFRPEPNGTLTVINNTAKDMVIFREQTPTTSTLLGGVKAGTSDRAFDISDDLADFDVGGYMILRGMTLDEYTKNKSNLTNAKIEYSAMATYGKGKKYRAEINSSYTGDYYFKVTNGGKIGIELRKDSPDGEKIGYLPALAANYLVYTSTSNSMAVYPVYVYYSNISKEVTTIKPSSWTDMNSISPRPVTDNSIPTTRFPRNDMSWAEIVAGITYPVAFVTVTNNALSSDARFASAAKSYFAQNGYDAVNSGETLTFEVKANDAGQQLMLNLVLFSGNLPIVVKDSSGNNPTIKNGYDYTVTLNLIDADDTKAASYSAVIIEGTKRNVETELSSL